MANKTTIQAFSGNAGAFAEEHAKKIRLYVENACGNKNSANHKNDIPYHAK